MNDRRGSAMKKSARGDFLRLVAAASFIGSSLASGQSAGAQGRAALAPPARGEIRVTLLGTGSPRPVMDRFGPSILVEAGVEKFVVDAGRGSIQRLTQLGVSYKDITGVLLTHLHSDHTVGLPDLWLTGWLMSARATPTELWGPSGTADLARHLEAAYRFDEDIRARDDGIPEAGGHLVAHDIGEQVVLERNGVKITAFVVDHGRVKPALGYRVDYAGRSVVLSGDTRYSPTLVRAARGADLLIHEVAAASATEERSSAHTRAVLVHHITPERAGELFATVKPKLAVYSHIVLFPGISNQELLRQTRRRYSGPLVVGEDLMMLHVGDSVRVERR